MKYLRLDLCFKFNLKIIFYMVLNEFLFFDSIVINGILKLVNELNVFGKCIFIK